MSWVEVIVSVIKLLFVVMDARKESNAELKDKKMTAAKQIMDGLANRDASDVTAGFDKLRNLLVFLVFTAIFLNGCGIILHPVYEKDIYSVPKGAVIKNADGAEYKVTQDGFYFSDKYIRTVIDAKVKQ